MRIIINQDVEFVEFVEFVESVDVGLERGSRRLAALFAALALVLAACGGSAAADADRPTVVATTSIVGDLVRNVVGDEADVEVIMGPGVDPHDFQASARQVATITEADLVVAVGLGLEESLLDVLESESERVLLLGPAVDPIEFRGSNDHGDEDHGDEDHGDEDHGDEDHGDEDHGDEDHADEEHSEDEHGDDEQHDHGALDPHVWQDPARMAVAVEMIGQRLDGIVDGAAERAADYAAELRALDEEVAAEVARIAEGNRKLVTTHEAFGYYADAYGFEIVGVIVPGGSTLAEPSAADLADLAHDIEESGVPAIFAEVSNPTTLADAVSGEVGRPIEVVELVSDALTDDTPTYIEMIRTNTERIVEALSG